MCHIPGCQISQDVKNFRSRIFPESENTQEVYFLRNSTYSTLEVNFPRKTTFPGSQLSWEVKFPGKSNFPGSELSREVTYPRKSKFPYVVTENRKTTFPGSQLSREVKFPGK